jgi:hypothetical protein
MGVDTAPEHGDDKSAITVWDYETMEEVFEYRGKCKVLDFVKVVKVAATEYKGLIVVENNSYGNQVIEQLDASEYSTMLYKERRGAKTIAPGISTNAKTRPLMVDALYSYISQFPECVKSERLALELTSLVTKTNGRVEADRGCHDDLAFATALCMYVRKYDPPMFIGTADYNMITEEMQDILGSNIQGTSREVENAAIMKYVKDKDLKGFVDILSMYNKS